MAQTHNISLTEQDYQFVFQQIEAGDFQSPAEVISAGLRLLEVQSREDAEKLAVLRKLTQEAIDQFDQGKGIEVRSEQELKELVAALGRSAAQDVKQRHSSGV